MKALRYRASIPAYLLTRVLKKNFPTGLLPLRLVDIPEPDAPRGWKKLKVLMCGVCGSDLALLYGKNSPRLSAFFSFPAILGHEILGEVDGQRVAVNPNLACRERGLAPCSACQRGEEHLCFNLAEGDISPGMLGFCRDLPGGWSEYLTAPSNHILPVPAGVPGERAVLAEPVAVALRGLRYLDVNSDRNVLVIGSGTIGLVAVRVMRASGYEGEIHVVARYSKQAELAKELGADKLHPDVWTAARDVGARAYRAIIGPDAWRGGYDVVIDAAGTPSSLSQASGVSREGGKLILLGSPAEAKHNFAPYWFREVRLLGSYIYSDADFRNGVKLLPELEGLEKLVTHRFGLSEWRTAIRTAIRREAIKVAFQPEIS